MNIAVIGLGLIGGSIAKAAKGKTEHTVYGEDTDETVLCRALLLGSIDEHLTDSALSQCDAIFVCLYPEAVLSWLREKAPILKKGAIVMDTCGIKREICAQAAAVAESRGFEFIGCHPMAGKEHAGFEYSSEGLFRGAPMIVTPMQIKLDVLERVKKLCTELGFASVVITTPAHHDEMIAYTSQLAHVVSSAFVRSPRALEHAGYSAGSYRDMTRVATLNEEMWTQLFLANDENLTQELDELIERLSDFSAALHERNGERLRELLRMGREQKEKADGKVL